MAYISLLSLFSRFNLTSFGANISSCRSITTNSSPLLFQISAQLFAEPLKKKKKIDPQVIKQREERKKKKIEKQIRRLEKNAQQLKPIDELEVPMHLIDNKKQYSRNLPPLSTQVLEEYSLLEKEWSRYKRKQHLADIQNIDRIIQSQQKALDELRNESEELYQEAIQIDLSLLPYTIKGPVATPPIKNYESPDGDYINISKKWN